MTRDIPEHCLLVALGSEIGPIPLEYLRKAYLLCLLVHLNAPTKGPSSPVQLLIERLSLVVPDGGAPLGAAVECEVNPGIRLLAHKLSPRILRAERYLGVGCGGLGVAAKDAVFDLIQAVYLASDVILRDSIQPKPRQHVGWCSEVGKGVYEERVVRVDEESNLLLLRHCRYVHQLQPPRERLVLLKLLTRPKRLVIHPAAVVRYMHPIQLGDALPKLPRQVIFPLLGGIDGSVA
mmetsp:Transcript_21587/g.41965  ORF Transcript_21587/g.41965 Transcript_21587/m.41965 type:complete len:235 (-) Transcript_21587:392-1096(-)